MTVRPQALDTAPEIEQRQIEAWRRMQPWEKLRIVAELMRATDELAVAGIRERHPNATPREIQLRLGALRIDRESMIRAFGWDPEQKGY